MPDAEGRARAGAAVEEARNTANLTRAELAKLAGVSVDTIRDLINGKRWPWPGSRRSIEKALEWEPGRLSAIARQDQEGPGILGAGPGRSDMVIDLSDLSDADRYEVLAFYHRKIQERDSGQAM